MPARYEEPNPAESSAAESARRRIVAQARLNFFAHGFRGVTMDDLAKALGMSKKTLYAHFPGKAALVEAVLRDKFQSVEADLERLTSEPSADFLQTLHLVLECIQRHTGEVQPPFVRDIRRESPELFGLIEDRRRKMTLRTFNGLLEEGRKAGIIREDIPARLIVEILLGAMQAIVNPPKMEELGLTPKTGLTAIITVILEGVVTDRGRLKP